MKHAFAERLRGMGPVGIVVALVILGTNLVIAPLGAVLVLLWKWLANVPWTEIGFRRPRNWVLTILGGVAAGIFLKLLLKALVIPLLGGPAVNAHFHFIAGNTGQLVSMILASIVVAGLGEEILYRGFLFNRLWRLFGDSRGATIAIVLFATAFFASIHIPEQGVYGGVQAAFTGFTFGTIYALTRSLWLPILIHATYDVAAVLIIYFDIEQQVARSILG